MAACSMPAAGVTLHGGANHDDTPKPNWTTAISLKLSHEILQDIKRASKEKNGLQFQTGRFPKLRIGHNIIDLTLSPDAFRTELYSTTAGKPADFNFGGIVSHRAELKAVPRKNDHDTSGSDAALAALQNSLASYEQEKQANATNITDSVLAIPRNRFEAARKQKQDARRGHFSSSANSSHNGTPVHSLGPAPTSVPTSEGAARVQAMRTPLIHLLALKPISLNDIISKTHIPKHELESILQKIGKQVDGKWQLTDRAFKELDVWKFGYKSSDDRQSAVDNAIRAYDRLRIGQDEDIWQRLLPKSDRGKGIVLSRLNLGSGHANRGLTPNLASPVPHPDGMADSNPASASNTPRLGGVTPRSAPKGSDVMKRLLSKDPKKARAQDDAKEKKRKGKESVREPEPSSRDGPKNATIKRAIAKRANQKIKSAELVHNSSDDSGVESESRKPVRRADPKSETSRPSLKQKSQPSGTLDKNDGKQKGESDKPPAKAIKGAGAASSSTASLTAKPRPSIGGKRTPSNTNTTISAPNSNQKSQLSPQKPLGKPTVPSPLGAARPRVASDISDRSAIGVQQSRARAGVDTPKGLGISNGTRKRHDTITSTDSGISSASDKVRQDSNKPSKQGETRLRQSIVNGSGLKADQKTKRKSDHLFSSQANDGPAQKYRKTEVPSSLAQKMRPSMVKQPIRSHVSPIFDSSDSSTSIPDTLTYYQGVTMAQKFRDVYYPAYAALYDEQAGKEERGEAVTKSERQKLWDMHTRLEQMKHDIRIASQRQHREG
ncbi:Hypothetical protein R9X50_00613700 [Acrodontium crateriforme]|uniref:E3 ubiquitin-protein ligase n=1 Tax=Acrodontium crateriforme TaxID=150365 RepID=A0AAQ3M972_9PEZI|nr:Hypothetical protein R9X50_00613700 [Acrodontium crateriforme]